MYNVLLQIIWLNSRKVLAANEIRFTNTPSKVNKVPLACEDGFGLALFWISVTVNK